MFTAPILLLILCVSPVLGPTTASLAPTCPAVSTLRIDDAKDAYEAAEKRLRRASHKDELSQRTDALDAFVLLGEPAGVLVLIDRAGVASKEAGLSRREFDEKRVLLDRRRVQLAEMELAAERKSSMKEKVIGMTKEVRELEERLVILEDKLAVQEPWATALRTGAKKLVLSQADGKRRSVLKDIWKLLDKSDDAALRVSSAELLADIGEKETAKRLAKSATAALDERVKMMKALPELEAKVHDWERKLQEENDKMGGNTKGTVDGYNQVLNDASGLRHDAFVQKLLAEDLLAAAAVGLANEAGEAQAASASALLKSASKSPHRLRLIELLITSGADTAREGLVASLAGQREPLMRVAVIDGLAQAGDTRIVEWLLASGLSDESWHVRSRSMLALSTLRSAAAVEPLLDALEEEEGRLRTDAEAALELLTAKNFNGNMTLWRRWWKDNKEGFVVSDATEKSDEEKALEGVGLTFFGLRTESEKVLFILDASGSMNEPMATYTGGGRAGETRLTVAKRELMKALAGVKDGGTFNIVVYAADVWTWSEEPVVMEAMTREEATIFVEEITAIGGTNIWGCIEKGLDMSQGRKSKKGLSKWVQPNYDTLFLLTDGQPSIGISTNREEILDMVRERNEGLGLVINTIGLSSDQDAVLMRRLAEENNGTYAAR